MPAETPAAPDEPEQQDENSQNSENRQERQKTAATPTVRPHARPRTEKTPQRPYRPQNERWVDETELTQGDPLATLEPPPEYVRRGTLAAAEREIARLREQLGAVGGGQPAQRERGLAPVDRFDVLERNRRQNVLDLWARGFNIAAIARSLKINRQTVQKDIAFLQLELQRDVLPQLNERLSRSAMVRYTVQQEAWQLFSRLPDNAHNKVAALELVTKAQDGIDRVTGVASPEEVNAAALIEMQDAVMAALDEVGGVQAQQAFVAHLRARSTLGFNPLQLPPLPADLDDTGESAEGEIEVESEPEAPLEGD